MAPSHGLITTRERVYRESDVIKVYRTARSETQSIPDSGNNNGNYLLPTESRCRSTPFEIPPQCTIRIHSQRSSCLSPIRHIDKLLNRTLTTATRRRSYVFSPSSLSSSNARTARLLRYRIGWLPLARLIIHFFQTGKLPKQLQAAVYQASIAYLREESIDSQISAEACTLARSTRRASSEQSRKTFIQWS